MPDRPDEVLKGLAARLAAAVTTEGGRTAAQLLRVVRALERQQAAGHIDDPPYTGLPVVGIWQATSDAKPTEFVRSPDAVEDASWSEARRIPPKSEKRRIVLVGESVARGFFFDPKFTVAQALHTILERSGAFPVGVEVVDLARTGQDLRGLRGISLQALALDPDALVVFGGNNWPAAVDEDWPDECCARAAVLREHGIAGLKRRCGEFLTRGVQEFVDDLAATFGARRIPVTVIIPEFNLLDWRDAEAIPPLLRTGRERWFERRRAAHAALDGGDLAAAERAASEMTEIDGETSAVGLRLRAEAQRRAGDLAQARSSLERARDASIWDPVLHSPRTYGVVQEVLRRECRRHGLAVVDLPEVFRRLRPERLPDRYWFLDYCHLTAEGIRAAMVATAEVLVAQLGGTARTTQLDRIDVPVAPMAQAEAHFAAAIHNSHWNHSDEVVEHHCARAVEQWPKIGEAMKLFVDLAARRAPSWTCRATEQLFSRPNRALVRYVVGELDLPRPMDRALVRAIGRTLGPETEAWAAKLLIEERARRGAAVELMTPFHTVQSFYQREALVFNEQKGWPDSFRAYDPTTRVALVEDAPGDLELRLTCRVPRASNEPARVGISVNGGAVCEIAVNTAWTKHTIAVPARFLRAGINDISIEWPPSAAGGDALDDLADAIERGRQAEYFDVLGEIHSLVAASPAN